MEHFSYLLKHGEKNIAVFAGDTLFNAGVGNCKNGGNIPILEKSIDQYYRNHYPDEVIIYPGHDYFYNNLEFLDSVMRTSVLREDYKKRITELKNKDEFLFITLKEEKEINPFLTTKLVEDVDNFKGLSQKEVFYYLRKLRDQW
jgi:hydroxyacylglutathione hydrolase